MRPLAGPTALLVIVAGGVLFKYCLHSEPKPDDNRWTYKVEDVRSGPAGPVHAFLAITLLRDGDRVQPVAYESSEKDTLSAAQIINALVQAPDHFHATKVDRCRQAGDSH
jgi:hypothetical protein